MKDDKIQLENYMVYNNQYISEVMDWAVDFLFSRVWNDKYWLKCAKGGDAKDSYKNKSDMFYIIHIFSGTAMALRVLDYKFAKDKPEDEEYLIRKLKRSIIGYLFHDYNKLGDYEKNKNMNDTTDLDIEIEKFSDILNELNMSKDEVYTIAFSTEVGTQYHSNSITHELFNSNQFESSFSRLADTLSSIFSEENSNVKDIYFQNQPIIPKSKIHSIKVSSTTFITFTSILRNKLVQFIKDKHGFYLWSTLNKTYYISEAELDLDINGLSDMVLSGIAEKAHLENGISLNDRRVNVSSNKVGKVDQDILKKFIVDNDRFRQVLHLENILLDDEIKRDAQAYSDRISGKCQSFSLDFNKDMPEKKDKKRSIREYLDIYDSDSVDDEILINERLHSFLVRYVQLQTGFNSSTANVVRDMLKDELNKNEDVLRYLLPKKNKEKSALLIPFIMNSEEVKWNDLLNDTVKDMNGENVSDQISDTVSAMIRTILNLGDNELPEVPDKSSMSMITGYPATQNGQMENLFGLGTNTFNNRLTTSGIANGKIDTLSIFEFSLRKIMAPAVISKYSSAILFLSFPGAVPFMDMGRFLQLSQNSEHDLKVNNIKLTIGDENAKLENFKFDSTYYIYLNDPKKDSDILRYLVSVISIALDSKLHAMVSFSNNIFYESWNETISFDLENSILNGMKWDKIRCNNILDVRTEINFFLDSGKRDRKIDYDSTATVLRDFLRDNYSLLHYVHSQYFGDNRYILSTQDKIYLMRKLVYGKKGGTMKKVEQLADIAADLYRLKWDSSANDRGWMLRESLEVLEKMKAETKTSNLDELGDFVSGNILRNLERLYKRDAGTENFKINKQKIIDFSNVLLSLIQDEFKGKVPSGTTRSYLIDGFEIEYMLKSDLKWNKGSE